MYNNVSSRVKHDTLFWLFSLWHWKIFDDKSSEIHVPRYVNLVQLLILPFLTFTRFSYFMSGEMRVLESAIPLLIFTSSYLNALVQWTVYTKFTHKSIHIIHVRLNTFACIYFSYKCNIVSIPFYHVDLYLFSVRF